MTTLAMLALQSGDVHMSTGGWIFMGLAWTFVVFLVLFSFIKVIWGGESS
jgi:hypothetical protein